MTAVDRASLLSARLADERGRRVAFVSHCLLNENTRYLGGAFHRGAAPEIVALLRRGIGLHQMPCPEMRAWGGVLKRHTLWAYGSQGTLAYRLRRPLLRAFVLYTRIVYARLARQVVRDVADYERSGVRVVGIVGVGSSPSCGVTTTLNLNESVEVLARCPLATIDRATVNERAVLACRSAGEGLYVQQLRRQLARRGLDVPFLEYDLAAEMRGLPQPDPIFGADEARPMSASRRV
jgi:predicted secreted protein